MKKVWEFFENMNEIVYVSDIEDYQIIYMNRVMRELYGIHSVEEVADKKCYELFQGSSNVCAFCTNKQLRPGYFEEWKYYNPVLEKDFMLKDTLVEEDGKCYRVELAIDVSAQQRQKKAIEGYINNETIINEALRLSLSSSVPEESMALLLEYIGKALKCERIYIFEEKEGELFSNTYEWCAQGVVPQKDNLQNIPIEDTRVWMERFANNKNVIVSSIEDIKETDPVMYEYLVPQNIDSLVVSPLIYNQKIIGFYGVDNPPTELLKNISTLFSIMGYFTVSLIRRRDLYKRLEMMSFYDELTGFRNRHAMDDYIASMKPEKSIGIVYCDVTGLKQINDAYGHKAGDELLVRACGCLRRAFFECAQFRIGGDEFLVLCAGITEEELLEKAELLRADMEEHSVVMAVGYVWRPDSRENIDKLLTEADARMYESKRKYYAEKNQTSASLTVEK